MEEAIQRWEKAGCLIRSGSRTTLSPKGLLLSNEIFSDLLIALEKKT